MLLATHKCVFYLACQPCSFYLLPVNGFTSQASLREGGGIFEENDEGSLRKNTASSSFTFSRSPSVTYGDSSLPEGAFDTNTSCENFIYFLIIGVAFLEPRDYRVVFVLQ